MSNKPLDRAERNEVVGAYGSVRCLVYWILRPLGVKSADGVLNISLSRCAKFITRMRRI